MIYLDNNSTTPIDESVHEVMSKAFRDAYGNPGSRHKAGRKARQLLEDSRETIAEILGALPEEVLFTSGGTESSNLAIHGLAGGRLGAVLLPGGEHPATEEPVQQLLKRGCSRRSIPLDASGRIIQDQMEELSLDDVVLATAILAHNETGVIQNLIPLAERCLEARVPFHVDAVQAVGKIPVSFRDLPATTMSIGAHKFHGPRGVGVLLVRKGCQLAPLMTGGHQEQGFRPGTVSVPLIAGMSAALQAWHQDSQHRSEFLKSLRDQLENGILSHCHFASVNGDLLSRLPNTSHVCFEGCDGDALLVALDLAGVCCSLGSACASGSSEPSPVLLAMGMTPDLARSSLRFSVGLQNTSAEIQSAIEIISRTANYLRNR